MSGQTPGEPVQCIDEDPRIAQRRELTLPILLERRLRAPVTTCFRIRGVEARNRLCARLCVAVHIHGAKRHQSPLHRRGARGEIVGAHRARSQRRVPAPKASRAVDGERRGIPRLAKPLGPSGSSAPCAGRRGARESKIHQIVTTSESDIAPTATTIGPRFDRRREFIADWPAILRPSFQPRHRKESYPPKKTPRADARGVRKPRSRVFRSELHLGRDPHDPRRKNLVQHAERRRVELAGACQFGVRVEHIEDVGGQVQSQRTGDLDVLCNPQVEVPQVRIPIGIDGRRRQNPNQPVVSSIQAEVEWTRISLTPEQIARDLESHRELI